MRFCSDSDRQIKSESIAASSRHLVKKKQPSLTRQQIAVSMSYKQRQKSMHACPLYTNTNNTFVKLNKTLRARNASIQRKKGA